jgi:hypothetical protein
MRIWRKNIVNNKSLGKKEVLKGELLLQLQVCVQGTWNPETETLEGRRRRIFEEKQTRKSRGLNYELAGTIKKLKGKSGCLVLFTHVRDGCSCSSLAGWQSVYIYVCVCLSTTTTTTGGDLLENQLWKKAPPLSSCKLMRF